MVSSRQGIPSVLYENRYCDQNEFDIVINHECISMYSTNSIIQIQNVNVKCSLLLIPMSANRCYAKTAVVGSDIFVLGKYDIEVRKTSCVDIRSRSTWKHLSKMPDSRTNFSVCSFMNSIYIIGGYLEGNYSKGCYKYETNLNKWTKIADLNIDRCKSACAVFEGKIVATGGFRYSGRTNSAESYDHYENKWTRLSDMICWRDEHSSFSMGNKLFVIGDNYHYAEVFDSTSRKFTLLNFKKPCKILEFSCDCQTISVCRKMFVFCTCLINRQPMLHVYHVNEKRWVSQKTIEGVHFRKPIIKKVPKQ